jgi:hypothetical protein
MLGRSAGGPIYDRIQVNTFDRRCRRPRGTNPVGGGCSLPFRRLCAPSRNLPQRHCRPPPTILVACRKSSWVRWSSWVARARRYRKSRTRFVSLRRRTLLRQSSREEMIPRMRSIRSRASDCLACHAQRNRPLNSTSPESSQCSPSRVSAASHRRCAMAARFVSFSAGTRITSHTRCPRYLAW